MNEALIILLNMRGGCATVGGTVHTLFRVNGRRSRGSAAPEDRSGNDGSGRGEPAQATSGVAKA
jgi:hypothetical protein